MPESLKNWLNTSKKVLKNWVVALALASTLASCWSDNNTMSFDRSNQSGKMSITYVGSEPKGFDIEIKKVWYWQYQGKIDEKGWWFKKEYSGSLDAIIASMTQDMQEQVRAAWVSSTVSGEELEVRASKKLSFFKEEYKKFFGNKQLESQEIQYVPDTKNN